MKPARRQLRKRPAAGKSSRLVDADVPPVPTVRPDAPPTPAAEAPATETEAEERVRRMVEAAYT